MEVRTLIITQVFLVIEKNYYYTISSYLITKWVVPVFKKLF